MLLASRIILTVIIVAVAYFALHKAWTSEVDLLQWLKKPGEAIPVKPATSPTSTSAAVPANEGLLEAEERLVFSREMPRLPLLQIGDRGPVLDGDALDGFLRLSKENQIEIRSREGRVLLSTLIRDRSGRVIAEIVNNEWKVSPTRAWDRNYSNDALEVRDETGDVVLQVRILSDRVQLQTKMYGSDGLGFGVAQEYVDRGGWAWYGKIETTHPDRPELSLSIMPIFQYPSSRHLGELRK